jgi:glycosyltransferase involved in cell wall biosynthesis
MKILVVHEVDYLEKVIYEVQEFPELLAQGGHEVVFFQFQEGAKRSLKNLFTKKIIQGRTIPEAKITLVGPHQFGFAGIDRLWATVSCLPAFIKLFRESKFDVVLNYAVPTYGLQLLLISKLFKVPFVQRALDSSHEIRKSIFKWPILLVEKLLYRLAPILSANNEAMKRYCEHLSGRTRRCFVNFPPLDIEHFSGQSPNKALQMKLGIDQTDNVITYMGSFFYFSGLPQVVKRFSELASKEKSVKLLLIGGGEQDKELRDMVSQLNLTDRVIFTGFVSYDDLPSYLSLSTVAINPLEISRVASIAFPNKVLQYLATGLPVVSTRLEGLVSALSEVNGLVWENSPSEVLDEAVRVVKTINNVYSKRHAASGLHELFSPPAALKSLVDTLYESIELKRKN